MTGNSFGESAMSASIGPMTSNDFGESVLPATVPIAPSFGIGSDSEKLMTSGSFEGSIVTPSMSIVLSVGRRGRSEGWAGTRDLTFSEAFQSGGCPNSSSLSLTGPFTDSDSLPVDAYQAEGSSVVWISAGSVFAVLLLIVGAMILILVHRHRSSEFTAESTESWLDMPDGDQVSLTAEGADLSEENAMTEDVRVPSRTVFRENERDEGALSSVM
jgi:hypothetical protein